ncbi:Holliday junction branch migration protein RuvA [bacterium]|jgi:Holliday junction DNA helicase RuvA|nr:Holliday junction branch migration protein RuvA [bacterium]MBT4291714.1 Holliday junction branch migration protein RuvA [bacterium]MBT7311041.1 Holliday junction branch migration protein RuvA [bacterium]
MIASIEGVLVVRGAEAVIKTGGLGLQVLMPANEAELLPAEGEIVRLHTHFSVREDGWTLFGFFNASSLALFKLLISVNGIGPKLGLGILSGSNAGEVALAIESGNERFLIGLPGIGKKTAARLGVELKGKIPADIMPDGSSDSLPESLTMSDNVEAAISVLNAMGLPRQKAELALSKAAAADKGIENDIDKLVKAALKLLS